MLLSSAAAILLAGGLIGATGIGGVLVVPTMTQLEGLSLQTAVAASSLAFAFPGVAALLWLRPSAQVSVRQLLALVAGALPGAACGGLLVHVVDGRWLMLALATLALGSGVRGLWPAASTGHTAAAIDTAQARAPLVAPALAALGLGVGMASTLTGTGGPVILIPLLMLLRQPLALTLAAAQVIQLPVALCVSAVHATQGSDHLLLACAVGLVLLAGSLAGQRLARGANVRNLQRMVSAMLIVTGLWFAWRLLS